MKTPGLEAVKLGAVLLAAAGAAYLIWRTSQAGAGILSGDNSLTRGATNAAGQPVTAYAGAGVIGTLGAAANAASGGYLATFGEWLGVKIYDLTSGAPQAADPVATVRRYQTGGESRDPWPEETASDYDGLALWNGIPSP